MMFKQCSIFHGCILRGFNFIEPVYELFDNPSYIDYVETLKNDEIKVFSGFLISVTNGQHSAFKIVFD